MSAVVSVRRLEGRNSLDCCVHDCYWEQTV
jgi:hypothetical protein